MTEQQNKQNKRKNTKFDKTFSDEEIRNLIKNNPEFIKYIEKVFNERKLKPFKDLTFVDGYMFGKVMINKDICKNVLEAILNIKIEHIEYIELEKTINETFESKSVRLDVYVRDRKRTVYNIEMQASPKGKLSLGKRMRYYQVMIDTTMLKKGKKNDYSKLKKSIIIFICPFTIFGGKRQIYTFNNYCKENKKIELKDLTTKIFISTKGKKNEKLNDDLEALIDYINGTTDNNSLVKKIDNTIKEIKKQEEGRIDYMLTTLRDMDALREGRDIGFKQGERRGEAQKTVNAIKSLIEVFNFSTEQAMKGLKIPVEEQGLYFRLVNDPDFCEKYFADESNFIDPSDYEDEDFEENEEDYYEKD